MKVCGLEVNVKEYMRELKTIFKKVVVAAPPDVTGRQQTHLHFVCKLYSCTVRKRFTSPWPWPLIKRGIGHVWPGQLSCFPDTRALSTRALLLHGGAAMSRCASAPLPGRGYPAPPLMVPVPSGSTRPPQPSGNGSAKVAQIISAKVATAKPKNAIPRRDKSLSALSHELIRRYGSDGTIIDLDDVQVRTWCTCRHHLRSSARFPTTACPPPLRVCGSLERPGRLPIPSRVPPSGPM